MTSPDFSPSWNAIGGAQEGRDFSNAEIAARALFVPRSLRGHAKLWSAAACCRFPPRELARQDFSRGNNSPPASWLEPKRQQAAALHSFAQDDSLDGFFRRL